MVICGQCGAGSEDVERFCGECGAYLEWDGETIVLDTPAAVTDEPAKEHQGDRSGLFERVRAAVGRTSGSEPQGRGLPAAGHLAGSPEVIDLASSPAEGGAASAPLPRSPSDKAAPVLPGAAVPKPRRREVQLDDRRPAPGEVVCGGCGAGNVPTRKFCRRCGADLADAPIVRRRPWWQRLLKPERKPQPAAGARVHRIKRRLYRRPLLLLIVLALLGGGIWAGRGRIERGVDIALDRIRGTQHVEPKKWAASSSATGHLPTQARDGFRNTFWAPRRSDGKRDEYLKASFNPPFRLVYLLVSSGVSKEDALRLLHARPRAVTLTFTRQGGSRVVKEVELPDERDAQRIDVGISDVTAVQLTIKSAYAVGRGRLIAIGEVEFFGRT